MKWMESMDTMRDPDMSSMLNNNTRETMEAYLELVFLMLAYRATPVTRAPDMNVVKGACECIERIAMALGDSANDSAQVAVLKKHTWIERFEAAYRDMPTVPHDQPAYVRPGAEKGWWQLITEPISLRDDALHTARPRSILDTGSYPLRTEFLVCFVAIIFDMEKFKTYGLDFEDYYDQDNMDNYNLLCTNIISFYDRMIAVVNQFVYEGPNLRLYFDLGNIEVLVQELRMRFEHKND